MTDAGEWQPVADGISESATTWWFEYRGRDRELFVVSVSHDALEWADAKALANDLAADRNVRAMAADIEGLGREYEITVHGDPHAAVWRKR